MTTPAALTRAVFSLSTDPLGRTPSEFERADILEWLDRHPDYDPDWVDAAAEVLRRDMREGRTPGWKRALQILQASATGGIRPGGRPSAAVAASEERREASTATQRWAQSPEYTGKYAVFVRNAALRTGSEGWRDELRRLEAGVGVSEWEASQRPEAAEQRSE